MSQSSQLRFERKWTSLCQTTLSIVEFSSNGCDFFNKKSYIAGWELGLDIVAMIMFGTN
jgi:hypothetical protein